MKNGNKPRSAKTGAVSAVFLIFGMLISAVGMSAKRYLYRRAAEDGGVPAIEMQAMLLAVLCIGTLFFLAGTALFCFTLYAARKRRRVMLTGEQLLADFVCAEEERRAGKVTGYYARLTCTDSRGRELVFYSERLPQDPTQQLTGRQVPVCADAVHPGRWYYVDMKTALKYS